MPKNSDYDLYCPKCWKKAATANPMFIRYTRRIQLPIFLCSKCRTVYIDKQIVRRMISEWRKQDIISKNLAPFKKLYQDLLGKLEEHVTTSWVPQLGYKRVRFHKRPKKSNP